MASEILGLFTSPEQYNMMQQQAQQNRALQFAQLDPFEKASYGIYQGAGQLANAGARLLGGEDPQLRMISQRQILAKEIDPADPESILRVAQKAGQMGDQQFALQLSDYARQAQVQLATAQQKMREGRAAAIPKEVQIAQTRADLIDRKAQISEMPDSPEKTRALAMIENTLASLPVAEGAKPVEKLAINTEITKLRTALRALPPGPSPQRDDIQAQIDYLSGAKEEKANIKEIGVAVGSNAPVYLDVNNDKQFIYTKDANGNQVRQPYFGGVDRTTARTNLSVNQKGETAFAEKLGALDAKDVADARANRDSSIAALNTLNELSRLNDQGLISGSYATGRVGAANLLNTLGLISPKDQATLASSENYQKKAGDLILATLGGRLGAGFSNEDRKFIQGLVPSLENSAAARRQLIDFMQKKNQAIVNEMTRLEDYAREKNSLKGFKPTIPIVSSPRSIAQTYTRAELEAAIAKKKREQEQNKGK